MNPENWTLTGSTTVLAVAAVAQLVVVTIAALAAWKTVSESKELRKAEHRPRIAVDFAVRKAPRVELVIANAGRLVAHNVTLTFSPEIKRPHESTGDVPLAELPIITDGITVFPPGKEYRYYFGSYNAMHRHPPRFEVRVRYDAKVKGYKPYDETTIIDVGQFAHTLIPDLDGG